MVVARSIYLVINHFMTDGKTHECVPDGEACREKYFEGSQDRTSENQDARECHGSLSKLDCDGKVLMAGQLRLTRPFRAKMQPQDPLEVRVGEMLKDRLITECAGI